MSEIEQLRKASEGLLWMSESDYPFDVFVWESDGTEKITPELVRERAGFAPDTSIQTLSIDEFFAPATEEKDWYNEEEKAQAKQYQTLAQTVKDCLKEVQVYRLGSTLIHVYIIGFTTAGTIGGLQTKVVET